MYCATSYDCEYMFYAPTIDDLKFIVITMIQQHNHLKFVIADFLLIEYDEYTGDLRYKYNKNNHVPKDGDSWVKGPLI